MLGCAHKMRCELAKFLGWFSPLKYRGITNGGSCPKNQQLSQMVIP